MGRVEACSAAVPVDEALAAVAGRVKVGLPVEKAGPVRGVPAVKGVQPQKVIVRVRVVPLVVPPVRVGRVEAGRAVVVGTSISIRWSV